MDHNKLNRQLSVGIVLGIVFGLLFAKGLLPAKIGPLNIVEIARFFGTVFVLLLKMVAVPLVFFSIFCGVTSLGDISKVGSLGKRTLTYYFATTFIAVAIGLLLVNIIKPGVGLITAGEMAPAAVAAAKSMTVGTLLTTQIETFFLNPFEALAKGTGAMIAIIIVSIMFAIGILKVKQFSNRGFIDLMNVANEAVMHVTVSILRLAPIGVGGIILRVIYDKRDSLSNLIEGLGLFTLTATLGLAIQGLIVLPMILKLWTGIKPAALFKGVAEPLKVAFGTSSSIAAMPVTLKTLPDQFGTSEKTTDFVVPLGATINMDGTALYEAVCALFIAQALGIDLTLFQQIIVFFTATIAGIGAAGIPSAGLVTLVIVLNAVNIPYENAQAYIGMIFTIDRFIDMVRTTVNVEGDCVGTLVIDKLEKTAA